MSLYLPSVCQVSSQKHTPHWVLVSWVQAELPADHCLPLAFFVLLRGEETVPEVCELQSHRKWQTCDLALFKCSQAFMEDFSKSIYFCSG